MILLFSFFFLMIRRPPRSTLFPTRRSSDLLADAAGDRGAFFDHLARNPAARRRLCRLLGFRSEEHTSELQSRPHLVCRLLLEKKKNKNDDRYVRLSCTTPESSTSVHFRCGA